MDINCFYFLYLHAYSYSKLMIWSFNVMSFRNIKEKNFMLHYEVSPKFEFIISSVPKSFSLHFLFPTSDAAPSTPHISSTVYILFAFFLVCLSSWYLFYWMCWALNHSFLSASVLVCLLLCFFFFYSFHRMQSMRREDQGLLEGENSVMVGIGLCCISVMVPPLTHIAQACHMPRKTAPKPFFKAAWRVGYAMVSRGNAGWTMSKSGHPCLC